MDLILQIWESAIYNCNKLHPRWRVEQPRRHRMGLSAQRLDKQRLERGYRIYSTQETLGRSYERRNSCHLANMVGNVEAP